MWRNGWERLCVVREVYDRGNAEVGNCEGPVHGPAPRGVRSKELGQMGQRTETIGHDLELDRRQGSGDSPLPP